MNCNRYEKILYIYILVITISSTLIILVNAIFQLNLPFSVNFLIAYVSLLFVFVVFHSIMSKGWKKTIGLLLFSFTTAFFAEVLGVNFGLIFGNYYYTNILGISLLGVPLLAALAWEPILYASFSITTIIAPQNSDSKSLGFNPIFVSILMALIGAFATTAWDMMIDPIAVSEGWWVWLDGGSYANDIANGVPISNFIGWLLVSFVIQLFYRLYMSKNTKVNQSSFTTYYGPVLLYISLFLTSIGVTITILKNFEVALIGFLSMAPFITIAILNKKISYPDEQLKLTREWFNWK